jgi:hypothetical protein
LSLEKHQAVFDWVERRLEEAGYPKEVSGLDRNCRSGVQSFWLPRTNRKHQEWGFFWNRGTKSKELARCALDPEEIANSKPSKAPAKRRECRTAHTSAVIEDAIRQLRSMTDGRREVFFRIGFLYAIQGLSRGEVEIALREVAGSDGRLLEKIPEVIESLERYGRLNR